ncbi:MAG: hypothetical protein COV35_03120 [Alphaproteobacteria bacterium CG11_big_fil_rev_8_21_14_0_20_39_49]|nr:MAG: hypothetical protein COV35_03120 [Alphaproteobacteria bacterium CG11_big_fil_rev_8_21_14_0_20_39_49]
MNIIKKTFILLILGTTFVFFVHSLYILFSSGFEWGDLEMTSREFVSQIILFLIKFFIILLIVNICRKKWY